MCLLVCALLFASKQHAQTFSVATEQLGINEFLAPTTLGCGVSVVDLDGNGWDDIFFGNSVDGNIICYYNDQMQFTRTVLFESTGDYKSTLAADYDNDGDLDILVTRDLGELLLLKNDGTQNFTNVAAEVGLQISNVAKSYGATWFDADNDGWLDLYVANFNFDLLGDVEIKDWFYHSNGDGTFDIATNEFGFSQIVDPTFQASAFPMNDDAFLDLYVINDVTRPNKLFLSDNNGFYTSVPGAEPISFILDAMTNTVGDFDDDGDFDIYITNREMWGNVFLRNDNGVFVDMAEDYGLRVHRFCTGSLWLDANNDLNRDLYVGDAYSFDSFDPPAAFTRDHLFIQNNGSFESSDYLDEQIGAFDTYSVAKSDLNKDGFIDLILSTSWYQGIQVLLNNGDSGLGSVRLNIRGSESNRDGVGTLIDYYVNGSQYREIVQCGSEYLNQNSKTLLLSCSDFAQIDSIYLRWSSGIVDRIYNVPSGSDIQVLEGQSMAQINQSALSVCPGMPVLLTLEVLEGSEVVWTNASEGAQIEVSAPGLYSATIISPDGFTFYSDSVEVIASVEPSITSQITPPACWGDFDGSVSVFCETCQSIIWENIIMSNTLSNVGAGTYTCQVLDDFGCVYDYEFLIEEPDPVVFFFTSNNASCFGASDGWAKVEVVFGGQPPYSLAMDETILFENFSGMEAEQISLDNLASGSYTLVLSDANGCDVSEQLDISQPDPLTVANVVVQNTVEIEVNGGTPPYSFEWGEWGDLGNAATLENGFYIVQISDANECIESTQFEINFIGVDEVQDAMQWWWNQQGQICFSEALEYVNTFDIQGQLIASNQNCTQLDLERWSAQLLLVEGLTQQGVSFNIRIWVP